MQDEMKASLYFQEGSSDKEYHIQLRPKDGGFVVNFQYGPRGRVTNVGTKTVDPVSYDVAVKAFNKLLNEKTRKGYQHMENGNAPEFQGAVERVQSGYRVQLLTAMPENDGGVSLEVMLASPDYVLEEKYDGERRLIIKSDGKVSGTNREGMVIPLLKELETALPDRQLVLDGEQIGPHYFAFDLLALDGVDLRTLPFEERRAHLEGLADQFSDHVMVVPSHQQEETKRAQLEYIRNAGGEGVVFKHKEATYEAGRNMSGIKCKFWESATVQVLGVNATTRSVSIGVSKDGALVDVGNVTIFPNQKIPEKGDLIEVRYLYVKNEGGSLYQPLFLKKREDKIHPDEASDLKVRIKDQAASIPSRPKPKF